MIPEDTVSLGQSKIKALSEEFVKLAEEQGFVVRECNVQSMQEHQTSHGEQLAHIPETGGISMSLYRPSGYHI